MATATHDLAGVDRDTAVLLAADLAVLAAEPSRYADYATAVRREYAHVDDDAWRAGRGAVLRTLLDGARSSSPPELGLDEWERRARANLTSELASIGASERLVTASSAAADAAQPAANADADRHGLRRLGNTGAEEHARGDRDDRSRDSGGGEHQTSVGGRSRSG